jgi:hypothetical protein
MFTKTALTAAIVLGTASVALASEADPNLLNRYPAYTQAGAPQAFTTRDVALTGKQSFRGEQQWINRASDGVGGGY